ncbi:MAG: hypothetical protein HY611_02435 [Elusimicrobia bacterium]|nr:hypothetical protein [Elusimicrobiota bacterium]
MKNLIDKNPRAFWGACLAADLAVFCLCGFALYSKLTATEPEISKAPTRSSAPAAAPAPVLPPAPAPAPVEAKPAPEPVPAAQPPKVAKAKLQPGPPIQYMPPAETEPAPPPAARPAAEQRSNSRPKSRRITIEYHNPRAKSVMLKGSFSRWKPIEMEHEGKGLFKTTLHLMPDPMPYQYQFVVDGRSVPDPLNPMEQKGKSLLHIR